MWRGLGRGAVQEGNSEIEGFKKINRRLEAGRDGEMDDRRAEGTRKG